jgi:ABC transport system ATP-binding/permease protein
MNVASIERVSKSYGEKVLFDEIGFTINDEDKIGVIGVNGTGKSTLLKIISGQETSETGQITYMKGVRIEYLSQNPDFDFDATILEQIFRGTSEAMQTIRGYEMTLELVEEKPDEVSLQEKLIHLTTKMKDLNLWDYESQVKTILTKLGIPHFDKKIGHLSGGQRKRVALAAALIAPCDLLILDEPTNHMDNGTIDWLEKYLRNRSGALLMITHDRYFLDRVVNKTIELDKGKLFTYSGNYTEFIEKKIERQERDVSIERKRMNLYRTELAWIRRGAKARTTKQKARIMRFEDIKEAKVNLNEAKIDISVANSRLGNKTIEIEHISKQYGELKVVDDFSYIVLRNDRVGIIGDNGRGKSTLLNLIVKRLEPDSGTVDIGTTVKIGYFSQESAEMDEKLRAIDYIKETAEFITRADGSYLSASQLMETFLFSGEMQYTLIGRLSGGERRRLFLLKILMEEPNILILDEPTNDLDIDTLKVLEDYLDSFGGAVISVSHDRYFLDRTCQKIIAFYENGETRLYLGNYSDYLELVQEEDEAKVILEQQMKAELAKVAKRNEKGIDIEAKDILQQKVKLTYKERLELESIQGEIDQLEAQLNEINQRMKTNQSNYALLEALTKETDEAEQLLLDKLERQEYLLSFQ